MFKKTCLNSPPSQRLQHIVTFNSMTDLESEAEPQLRRSERTKTPLQKGELYSNYEGASCKKPADRWENFERKKTVKKKRAAAAMDAPLLPSARPPTAKTGIPSPPLKQRKTSASTIKKVSEGKGKGKEPVTPAAVLSKSSCRLLTPIEEDDKGPYAQFDHPGPRPKPTNDPINDGVVLEEWQRQRLLWFLVQRNGQPIDPDLDYDEMKKLLGPDGNWHSEDKTRDASIFVGRLFVAPANTCIHKEEIGWYDDEPSPRKPVPVKALATPPAKSAPPPGNKTQKSNTATNLFKPKPPNGPHNLSQLENLPQHASQSTGERLKPCIIRASKLVIQQPNSHAPKVASGPFAAAQSRPVTTTGQPVCPSEFPPLRAQPSYPSEPWGQLGAHAPPDRDSNLPFGPLGSHSYQRPPPPNWAPSQAPPPGRNHFDHNTGPTGPSGSGPSGSGSTAHQAPPPNRPLGSSLPYRHPSAAPAQQSGPTSQHGQFQAQPRCNEMLGGREEPPRQNSQPIPSNAAQHNQQRHVLLNLTRSGPSSSGALLRSKSKRSSAKQKRIDDCKAMKLPDKDKGGMEGDEDKPIDTHKSGSCGRLKDFHGPEKHVLQWAGCLFIAIMASRGMYKTDIEIIDQRRLKAWTAACKGIKVDPNDYPIALAHVENLDNRLCAWRSHSRDHMVDHVKYYFFNAQMSRAKVKEEVEQLKTGALHTKPDLEPGTGYFQHPLLQIFLNKNLSKFKKDIGPQFPQYFKKVTRELICFSCAIIQFLVEEWDTGVCVRSNLDFKTQQKAYNTHLESHAVFLGESPGRWALIQDQLFARAFKHSGASKSAIPLDNKNVLCCKDVRSDAPSKQELAACRMGKIGPSRTGYRHMEVLPTIRPRGKTATTTTTIVATSQSTADLINGATTATTFKPGSVGKPGTVIQSAARLVRTTTK
ncbi:hypothetical protein RHS04_08903, partial [Rhizoctonia solani]